MSYILSIKLANHKISVSILALCPIIIVVGVSTLTWMENDGNCFRILCFSIMQ